LTVMTIATSMMAMVTATMTMTTMMMMMTGNDDNNDCSGSQRATAAADGMVWGRCQAAEGGGYGNEAEMGTMWV
jgi:hypothetical protein